MNREDERLRQLQGALELLKTGVDRGSRRVEDMHLAIAARPFRVLSRMPLIAAAAAVVEAVHDGITRGVHVSLRGTGALALGAAIRGLDRVAIAERPKDNGDGFGNGSKPE